jgi:hypothetical protein
MYKFALIGLFTLVTSLSVNAANSQLISHKEWAPKNITFKVTNGTNKKVESMIAMQKKSKRMLEVNSESQLFLADYVVDSVGKVGEISTIESYVGGYIINNTDLPKNYFIETSACTDFLFADNCAQVEDIITLDAKAESPIMHKITIQFKFDQADEHNPTTVTTITELKNPTLDMDGISSFTTGSIGKLSVQE